MISYSCKSCGAQLELGNAGSFECPYCGVKAFMSDADFRGHLDFRKKLLSYYKAKNDAKETDYTNDTLWECAGQDHFQTRVGQNMSIAYMYKFAYSNCICYVAKESVIYVFDQDSAADCFMLGLGKLQYPEADNKLYRCFPELKTTIEMEQGKALVFTRRPHFYPIEVFAPLKAEHTAWVISRLENICCALQYSQIDYNEMCKEAIFANVKTHECTLFGDWSKVCLKKSNTDLEDIRKIAKQITLPMDGPELFHDFLNSKPASNAFDDFSKWDQVIEKGFGGHNFVQYE